MLVVVCGIGLFLTYDFIFAQSTYPKPALDDVVSRYYDKQFLIKAAAYHHERLGLFFAHIAIVFLFVFILLTRRVFKIARFFEMLSGNRPWLARLIIISIVFAIFSIIRLPFLLAHFNLAHDFGLRQDRLSAFLLDWMAMKSIAWLTICVPMLAVLAMFARFQRCWWLVSGLMLGVLAVGYIMLAPLVIDPLFNQFKKLDDSKLNQQLVDLAGDSGVDVDNIWVADASRRTLRANAYFSGFLGTQRIVLYDTLLQKYSDKEIINIVAHELAHWKQKHIIKGILIAIVGLVIGLFILHQILSWILKNRIRGISRRTDPVLALPVYVIYIVSAYFVMAPANWVSRQMEMEADQISLELTRDPETFIQTSVKLARQNLSQVFPPAWIEVVFYTHPANVRRIHMAEAFKERILFVERQSFQTSDKP